MLTSPVLSDGKFFETVKFVAQVVPPTVCLSVCLSVWASLRKRPHQRSQDSKVAVRPRRETVMTLTVRQGTMWPSNSHQSQTGVSFVWQTPLWNKLIFHQMKEQTFWVLLCKARQTRVTMLMTRAFQSLQTLTVFFPLNITTVRVFRLPYFSIDKAHLMYNAHPKLFRHSFWCIDNAHNAN
jgi:hypothetical protein